MPSKKICFLLFPDVHLLDLSGSVQAFYEAKNLGNISYDIIFASVNSSVISEQGLSLSELQKPENVFLQENDFIIIPGTDFVKFLEGSINAEIEQVKEWIFKQYDKGVKIASICSGSLILAKLGLLHSKKCTTHWKCIDYLKDVFPEVKVESDKLFNYDQNIYTSAGMTSGIDMSLSIIEEEQGPIVSTKVARELVVYLRRQGASSQNSIYLDYHTHFNPLVHKVQNHIISNPSQNFSLTELAKIGNTSVRNLTREFKKATGSTVIDFKNNMKLELAKELINNPNYTIDSISEMCGFSAPRQLQRLWRDKFGSSISESRG
ncbi:MAG: GlxA family transcriptional regulator [Balneola sp.]